MSPASQTLRRRTTRPRRPRPVHSRNHQERPQEYKDRGAGGRRPLGRVGIMVVGAERRPRRLGDARREASLESWSWEPRGGRGGSATRAARRVWNHGRGSRGAAAEARRRAPRGESGIMVVGAEGRPRRLGDARREASLESWSWEPRGGRGGSATRAARRVWNHAIVIQRCTHAGTTPRPAGSRASIFSSTPP